MNIPLGSGGFLHLLLRSGRDVTSHPRPLILQMPPPWGFTLQLWPIQIGMICPARFWTQAVHAREGLSTGQLQE
jgi:hypothetical protein